MLPDEYTQADAPGAAVAVLRYGRMIAARTCGLARLDDRATVTPRTSFRLASITKQFTAKAVALLIEDGLLSLDAPVARFLPELPAWGERVQIGHLVAHTAGLVPYETLIPADQTTQVTDRDVVRLLADCPDLRVPPGARFEYDNGGYALLAMAVEAASGQRYPEFLARRIFRPLGMTGTVAHVEGRTVVERRAIGYRGPEAGGRWVEADQGVATAVLGDGGIYASLADLTRWDAALHQPGYQPGPAALAPFAAPVAEGVGYGFGWFLDTLEGRRRQRHEGWSTGFQHEIQRFPDDGLTVIALTNRAEPPARPLAEAIARRS